MIGAGHLGDSAEELLFLLRLDVVEIEEIKFTEAPGQMGCQVDAEGVGQQQAATFVYEEATLGGPSAWCQNDLFSWLWANS